MCKHINTEWQDNDDNPIMICEDCGKTVGHVCSSCYGNGWVESADYHCDWVNYGPYETEWCPECKKQGIIYTLDPEDAREFCLHRVSTGRWLPSDARRQLGVAYSTVVRWMAKEYGENWRELSAESRY